MEKSHFLVFGVMKERRQELLLVSSSSSSSSHVIQWQCERSVSRRGEDKPDGERRDASITSTEVEGGDREKEGARGVVSTASTVASSQAKQQKPPAPYVYAHQWVYIPYA
ncbi:hypothetical protein FQA47_004455 [Oryzias melastigma]|uniref:Uncharacterized protein n=1 Tax=Oryzias melastigma TaxID=30732 RepID=A0A834FMS8_ORYME|nr:hypothetical protein FQA47_004455 [Oryzias melastigma]